MVAEGEGFEPPVPFRVQWFSRPPPSTTRPSLPPSQAYNTSLLRWACPCSQAYNAPRLASVGKPAFGRLRRQPAEKNRHRDHEMQSLEAAPRLFRPETAPIRARIL